MSLSTCVPTCVCTTVCVHTCVHVRVHLCVHSPPSGHPSLALPLAHDQAPPGALPGRVQHPGPLGTGWGAPRVQPDAGTGKDQGCQAACSDARLPDGPRGPRRFLHLAGPWVPPHPVSRGPGCCWALACGALRGMSVSACSPAAAQDPALWVSESPCPQAPKPCCCGLFTPAPSAFMPPADPRPGRRQRRRGSPLGLTSQVPESPAVAKTHVGHDSEGAGGQTTD